MSRKSRNLTSAAGVAGRAHSRRVDDPFSGGQSDATQSRRSPRPAIERRGPAQGPRHAGAGSTKPQVGSRGGGRGTRKPHRASLRPSAARRAHGSVPTPLVRRERHRPDEDALGPRPSLWLRWKGPRGVSTRSTGVPSTTGPEARRRRSVPETCVRRRDTVHVVPGPPGLWPEGPPSERRDRGSRGRASVVPSVESPPSSSTHALHSEGRAPGRGRKRALGGVEGTDGERTTATDPWKEAGGVDGRPKEAGQCGAHSGRRRGHSGQKFRFHSPPLSYFRASSPPHPTSSKHLFPFPAVGYGHSGGRDSLTSWRSHGIRQLRI